MKRRVFLTVVLAIGVLLVPALCSARGTRYFINWPKPYVGPVYVQIYDIRCNPPYELLDRFCVWVTWGNKTKRYDIGNRGTYLLQLYKYEDCTEPMIVSGNAASFRIRYSISPPWI
jgi:hypothetical protein